MLCTYYSRKSEHLYSSKRRNFTPLLVQHFQSVRGSAHNRCVVRRGRVRRAHSAPKGGKQNKGAEPQEAATTAPPRRGRGRTTAEGEQRKAGRVRPERADRLHQTDLWRKRTGGRLLPKTQFGVNVIAGTRRPDRPHWIADHVAVRTYMSDMVASVSRYRSRSSCTYCS